jgi:hypothetical protein
MTFSRWSVRVTALVSAVLIAGCDGSTPADPQGGPATEPSDTPLVAFHQDDRMRFADSTGRVWSEVPVTSETPHATWSADSEHFAWLDDSRLHIVEAKTGEDHEQPCPCAGLGRIGDSFGTLSADGGALLLFDLGQGVESTRVPLPRPMATSSSVVAGGADQLVVVEPIPEEKAAYRGQSALLAMGRDGTVRPMIDGDSAVSLWNGFISPDNNRIATIDSPSSGACSTTPGLLVLDSTTINRKAERSVPGDAAMAGALLGDVRLITGVTWADDGVVVTFGPNPSCQANYRTRYVTYHLKGSTWQYLRSGLLAAGFGGHGRAYGIELAEDIKVPVAKALSGKLVLTGADGARKELGEGVKALWPTPQEQQAGRPAPSGSASADITVTERGEPLDDRFQALAKQVSKALESNDSQALGELCAKCDSDTLELIKTPEGRDRLRGSLTAHPAVARGAATFPGLSLLACVDAPTGADACTTQQIQDSGTLALPPESSSFDNPGSVYSAPVKGSVRFTLDDSGTARWVGKSISAKDFLQKRIPGLPYEEQYYFRSPDGAYACGFTKLMTGCQGKTTPVPPRPASCAEGPGWGYGISIDATRKVDFLCAGGVMFYPVGRTSQESDKLAEGQTVSAMGYTCTAVATGMRCLHDESGHGFEITPTSNKIF